MFIIAWITSWIYCLSIHTTVHEFHTSLAQVYYNTNSKSFEITLRVFTDDFETALAQENGNEKVHLENAQQTDALISRYLDKHFAIIDKQNQKKKQKFIGKELEVDVTWVYVEVPMGEGIDGIQIQNSILTDVFDDQVNIVNFKYLTAQRTYLFKEKQTVQKVNL